jgi:hypothetical protein
MTRHAFFAFFASALGLLAAPTSTHEQGAHDVQNARCMKPGCFGILRDGFGGGFNEKVYECSLGHKFVVKKR